MAAYYALNEYRKTKVAGVERIEATGKLVTVKRSEIAMVYPAGIGYDGNTANDVFTVHLVGGRKVITEETSFLPIGLISVSEYVRTTQEDGSRLRVITGQNILVVHDESIVTFDEAGLCYTIDNDGINSAPCYRIGLRDGSSFFTDAQGKDDILNY